MIHQSSDQAIVVYHSLAEQRADQFLWEEGGIVYICGLMLVVVVIAIIEDRIRDARRRQR